MCLGKIFKLIDSDAVKLKSFYREIYEIDERFMHEIYEKYNLNYFNNSMTYGISNGAKPTARMTHDFTKINNSDDYVIKLNVVVRIPYIEKIEYMGKSEYELNFKSETIYNFHTSKIFHELNKKMYIEFLHEFAPKMKDYLMNKTILCDQEYKRMCGQSFMVTENEEKLHSMNRETIIIINKILESNNIQVIFKNFMPQISEMFFHSRTSDDSMIYSIGKKHNCYHYQISNINNTKRFFDKFDNDNLENRIAFIESNINEIQGMTLMQN
jgi:hypothetical protein